MKFAFMGFGMGLSLSLSLSAMSSFAGEYSCSVSYGPGGREETVREVTVIVDNPRSTMGTRVQFNTMGRQAFVAVRSSVRPEFQDATVTFTAPDADVITNEDDQISAVTGNGQSVLLISGQLSGSRIGLSCELR